MKHFIEIDGEIVPIEFTGTDAAKTRDSLMELESYANRQVRILRMPDFTTVKRIAESSRWKLVGSPEN